MPPGDENTGGPWPGFGIFNRPLPISRWSYGDFKESGLQTSQKGRPLGSTTHGCKVSTVIPMNVSEFQAVHGCVVLGVRNVGLVSVSVCVLTNSSLGLLPMRRLGRQSKL